MDSYIYMYVAQVIPITIVLVHRVTFSDVILKDVVVCNTWTLWMTTYVLN